MGFLDRFSKDSAAAPDAFTIEVTARIRALPNVTSAEALDADTVEVTWSGWPHAEAVDISGPRQPWKQAKGFDRIEIVDDFMASLAPGQHPAASPTLESAPAVEAAATPAVETPAAPPSETARSVQTTGEPVPDWSLVASQLVPVLRRSRPADGTATWPIGELLEATAIWAGGATPITTAQCDTWGIGLDDVRSAATDNLVAIDPAPDPIGPDTRAWVPTSPEGLQSSWLAAPRPLLDGVGLTTAIVLVPLRSELVLVDPDDSDLVESILANTLAIIESQTGILCPVPFVVTGDDARTWLPPPDHPASELVRQTRDLAGL